jgi:hypothetical protein
MGPTATVPVVSTAVPTGEADGPMDGTLCKKFNKKVRYREGGKVQPVLWENMCRGSSWEQNWSAKVGCKGVQ